MNFISFFIKGVLMGAGAVAPGVSGGALAVIFGLYEKITDAFDNIFKNIKQKVVFFFPIVLGGGVGVLIFSRLIKYLFENYNAEVKYLFIGLMLGTLPGVFKEANKQGYKSVYMLPLVIALAVTVIVTFLDNNAVALMTGSRGLVQLIMYGVIIGFGTIIPGISASFILMYLGAYETLLGGIADVDLAILIPVGIGFGLSIIVFAKIINYLFKKAYGYTYYTVLGFVMGSIVSIYPGISFSFKYLVCVFLFLLGFGASYYLGKYKKDS